MDTKDIHISDYNYPLPDERIAKFPKAERDTSKLLIYEHGEVGEDVFYRLPDHLPEGALMVMNNTKVIQARLHFRKNDAQGQPTGALIEIFLLEPAMPRDYEQMFQQQERCQWLCLIGNQKKWKEGTLTRTLKIKNERLKIKDERLKINDVSLNLTATRKGEVGTSQLVEFTWSLSPSSQSSSNVNHSSFNVQRSTFNVKRSTFNVSFADMLDAMGELPIPPYLNRETQESDKTTYQTVYSKIKGSVAAPTAGLHFTPRVLDAVDARGIERQEVTLHVGAGTFRPVKSETIGEHPMHTEYIAVRRETIERLLAHDCQAIAVGTTSVRTLESLYYMGLKLEGNPALSADDLHVCQWEPYENAASITPRKALQNVLEWYDRNGETVLHSSTQIIIAPGYDYKIVKMLITNFHQPQSTLLLLVSAFVRGDWRKIYDYALAHDFRFLSYGDSSLLIP